MDPLSEGQSILPRFQRDINHVRLFPIYYEDTEKWEQPHRTVRKDGGL